MVELPVSGRPETEGIEEVLNCILDELKGIKLQLGQQNVQNGHLGTIDPQLGILGLTSTPTITPNSTRTLSALDRTQKIIHEAIRRYKSDSVPTWSTLYGTNMAREEVLEDLEIIARDDEWTSITGDCWKIPNDNRVRNFLLHYHKPEGNGYPKGENFNIWDWFDTGISAYWFPGKKISSMPQDVPGIASLQSGQATQLSHLVAPWRRIINFQGLTTLENCERPEAREAFSDSDLCPFFLSETGESIFQRPIDEMIGQIVKCHLRCARVLSTHHGEMSIKDCALFHVTFYEILPRNHSHTVTELWPCGDLYGHNQQRSDIHRQIREAALTLIAIPSRDMPGSKARSVFWTMVCLRPSQFPHLYYSEQVDDLSRGHTHEMIDDMSDLVHKSLVIVVSRWEGIAHYFDEFLSEKRGLLNPEYHDSLLTDDKTLSRSKKYFWAIEFLKEAGNSISDNIQQTKQFLAFLELNPPEEKLAESEFNSRIRRHRQTVQKLEGLETRFKQKKEEAIALRDGLFSASAVIESRASTQLGENIKLLTFVSIFFLPLSFCASMWSVNNSVFSLAALAITMPVVGICTYVLVFNLSAIATFVINFRNSALPSKTSARETDTTAWRNVESTSEISKASEQRKSRFWPADLKALRRLIALEGMKGNSPSADKAEVLGDLRNVHVDVQVDVESCSAT